MAPVLQVEASVKGALVLLLLGLLKGVISVSKQQPAGHDALGGSCLGRVEPQHRWQQLFYIVTTWHSICTGAQWTLL